MAVTSIWTSSSTRSTTDSQQTPDHALYYMLELFQAEGRGYSQNVRKALTELGLSYIIHNPRTGAGETQTEQTHDELRTLGGQDQIPFLVDHQRGVTMYESDDIVDYLNTHYR